MSQFTSEFGQRLQRARVAAGLTQTELGDVLSLSRSSIANTEAGRQACYAEQVIEYADALGIDPHWLLTGRGPDQTANLATAAANRALVRRFPELAAHLRELATDLDRAAKGAHP